jgi:hypothetical protein
LHIGDVPTGVAKVALAWVRSAGFHRQSGVKGSDRTGSKVLVYQRLSPSQPKSTAIASGTIGQMDGFSICTPLGPNSHFFFIRTAVCQNRIILERTASLHSAKQHPPGNRPTPDKSVNWQFKIQNPKFKITPSPFISKAQLQGWRFFLGHRQP